MNIAVGNGCVTRAGPNVRGGRGRQQRRGNRNCFVAILNCKTASGNLATIHVLITAAYRCKRRQDKKKLYGFISAVLSFTLCCTLLRLKCGFASLPSKKHLFILIAAKYCLCVAEAIPIQNKGIFCLCIC